jgi:hypothetical protein
MDDWSTPVIERPSWTPEQLAELEFFTWYLRTDPDLPAHEIERFLWVAAGYIDWLLA